MIAVLGVDAATTVVIMIAGVCAVARLLWLVRGLERPDDGEPGSEDDDDGGNKRPDPPSPDDRGGGEPPWWPQFERDFAGYVERVSAVGTDQGS